MLNKEDTELWRRYIEQNNVPASFKPNGVNIVPDENFKVYGYIHDWEYEVGGKSDECLLVKEWYRCIADCNFAIGVLKRGHPIKSVIYFWSLRVGGWYRYYFS